MDKFVAPLFRDPRRFKRVLGELLESGGFQAKGLGGFEIVLVYVAPEVSGVVRVYRCTQPIVQELLEVVVLEIFDNRKFEVRKRADRERNSFGPESLNQLLVFEASHSVVNATDVKNVESFPDIFGRAFLSGMGDHFELVISTHLEHLLEFRRRVADFGRFQADSLDLIEVRSAVTDSA